MAIVPVGAGRYTGEIGTSFSFGRGMVHGGIGIALAVRAGANEVDASELTLRTATAVFVSPLHVGAVQADVRVLHRGRSMVHCSVDVGAVDGDGPSLTAIVGFGRSRPGRSLQERTMPEVPPPDACPNFQDSPADAGDPPPWVVSPLWENVDRRIAAGHPWWGTAHMPGRSEGAIWLRYREVPRQEDGQVNPLAHVALSDMLDQSISEGLAAEDFGFVSIDHTVHLLGRTADEWCLVSHRSEYLADGYTSLRGELWDQHGTLLATMSQAGFIVDL